MTQTSAAPAGRVADRPTHLDIADRARPSATRTGQSIDENPTAVTMTWRRDGRRQPGVHRRQRHRMTRPAQGLTPRAPLSSADAVRAAASLAIRALHGGRSGDGHAPRADRLRSANERAGPAQATREDQVTPWAARHASQHAVAVIMVRVTRRLHRHRTLQWPAPPLHEASRGSSSGCERSLQDQPSSEIASAESLGGTPSAPGAMCGRGSAWC